MLKSVPQYNAEISQAAILVAGFNFASQPLLQTSSLSFIPGASSAASQLLFQAAFWSNEHVLFAASSVATAVEKFIPSDIKASLFSSATMSEAEVEHEEVDALKIN